MELKDFISAYAALLSTGLVVRELWKLRSASHPLLQASVDEPRLLRRSSLSGQEEGILTRLLLRNCSSVDVAFHAHSLAVPRWWVPTLLLAPLGARGLLPCGGKIGGKARKWARSKVVIPAGGHAELSVVLWQRDRQALERGRLVVNMAPLQGEGLRSQQFLVKTAFPASSTARSAHPLAAAQSRTSAPQPS